MNGGNVEGGNGVLVAGSGLTRGVKCAEIGSATVFGVWGITTFGQRVHHANF
jgi:hypothetical protein